MTIPPDCEGANLHTQLVTIIKSAEQLSFKSDRMIISHPLNYLLLLVLVLASLNSKGVA